jgi:hypothetical protein
MATMRRLVDDSPQAMASLNPELPPWFIAIVDRLLEKDPSRRFGSAKEVSELLEGCLAHLQQPASVLLPAALPKPVPQPDSGLRKSRFKRVIAVFAILGIGLFGAVMLLSPEPPDIAGQWSGEDWGNVVLKKTNYVEFTPDDVVAQISNALFDAITTLTERVDGYDRGHFLRPTILDNVPPAGVLARTEIFGPVLSFVHARDIDEAIALVNASAFGNQACLFTRSGASARKFRYEAQVGNLGINLGVAAPVSSFPFSGWKGSFFGDLHGQGRDAIEFYTDKKVVISRWW